MTSLDSMIQKLKPLGFYNINTNTLIYAELSAYATAFNIIESLLKEIEEECFISTAKSYGLNIRERLFGPERTSFSTVNRRNLLLYKYSITSSDFTKESIEKVILNSGVNGYVIEVPSENKLYINCLNLIDPTLDKNNVKNFIQEFLPAHLECIFDFRDLQWNKIDSLNKTFDELDEQNYSWDDIDNYNEI